MTPDQIGRWFKCNVGVDRFKAGVKTFTALQVLNLLINFHSEIMKRNK